MAGCDRGCKPWQVPCDGGPRTVVAVAPRSAVTGGIPGQGDDLLRREGRSCSLWIYIYIWTQLGGGWFAVWVQLLERHALFGLELERVVWAATQATEDPPPLGTGAQQTAFVWGPFPSRSLRCVMQPLWVCYSTEQRGGTARRQALPCIRGHRVLPPPRWWWACAVLFGARLHTQPDLILHQQDVDGVSRGRRLWGGPRHPPAVCDVPVCPLCTAPPLQICARSTC